MWRATVARAFSALMSGVAYATSAEMAGELGSFAGYAENRDAMLRVIRNHRRAAHGDHKGYEESVGGARPARRQLAQSSARN